jgi:hypothetical protein
MLSATIAQTTLLPAMAQPPPKGTITGKIYDGITGNPIADARVELRLSNESWMGFNNTWTNSAGEFSFELSPATYHVLADKWPNYTSPCVKKFIRVEAGSTVSVDLFLWPTGRLNGTIEYEGTPSDMGADLLFVNSTSGNVVARKYASVWNGSYTMDAPAGDYIILSSSWGYGPGRITGEVSSVSVLQGEQTAANIELRNSGMDIWVHTPGWKWTYMPGSPITYIVEARNTTTWEPISNASVSLYFYGPVDWPMSEPHDYSSNFADLQEIKPGVYIVRTTLPSDLSPGQYNLYATVRKDGKLGIGDLWFSIIQYRLEWYYAKSVYSPSESLSFRFTVDNGLSYVTDLDICYAIVEQYNGTSWVYNVLKSGKAVYDAVLKEYKVDAAGVVAAQGHKYRVALLVGQNTYEWWFEGGDLPVIFTALSKYPIHIELGVRNMPPSLFTCDRKTTIIEEEYWYTRMRLPIADVDWIHIFYDNISTPAMDIFESWDSGPNATALVDLNNTLVTFTANPAGEIRGTIRDSDTGEPVGDVEVMGMPIRYANVTRWAYARSEWDGSYRLPVTAGRSYLLKFSAPLYEGYKTDNETYGYSVASVGGAATVDVNLTRVPTGTLTGVVFWDVDSDKAYNSSVDMALSNAWVSVNDYSWNFLGGVNTASNGRYTFSVRADTFLRVMTWYNETFRSKPIEGISVAEDETLRLDIPMERAIVLRGTIEGPWWADCLLLDGDYNVVERIGESSGRDFRWSVPSSVQTLIFRTWGDYYPTEVSLPRTKTESEYDLGIIRLNATTLNVWSYMKEWENERRPGDSVKFYVEAMNRTGNYMRSVEGAEVTYKLWDSTGQFLSNGTGIYKDGKYLVNVSVPMYAKPGPVELMFLVRNDSLNYYGVCGGWFSITTLKIVTLMEATPYSTEESPVFAWLVLNASNLPACNVHVEYELYSTSGTWEQKTAGDLKGSSTGIYNITLPVQPEGSYQIHVIFDKQCDRWMWFNVVANLTRVKIYGHVTDKDGEAVDIAAVELNGGGMGTWIHYVTMTNASGYYEAFLPKGGYGVHVTKGSMRTLPEWKGIEVPPRVFDFTLYQVGFLEGRVVDPPSSANQSVWVAVTVIAELISTNLWNASTPGQHLPAAGTTLYLPGVKVGDEANYTIAVFFASNDPAEIDKMRSSNTSGLPENGTITLRILNVVGRNVTYLTLEYDVNGTLRKASTSWIDVETGMRSKDERSVIVAANLTKGDHLFNNTKAPSIADTIEKLFLGTSRLVNLLRMNATDFAWDRSTGILCNLTDFHNETYTPQPPPPGPGPGPGPVEGYDIGAQVLFWNATTGKLVTMEWVYGYFTRAAPTGMYDITFMDWGLIPCTVYNVTIQADETTTLGDIKLYRVDWKNQLWCPCDPWQTTPGKNVTVEVDLSTNNWQLGLSESITGLPAGNFSLYLIGWRWPQPPTGYEGVQFTVGEDSGRYTLNITIPEGAEAGCWDGRLVISAGNATYLVNFGFNLVSLYVGATPQKRNFYSEETVYLVTIVTTPDNVKVTGLEDVDFRIRIFGPYGEVSGNFTTVFYELGHGVYLTEFPIPNGTSAGGYSIEVTVNVPNVGSATDWQWFQIAGKKTEPQPTK